ncbi:MMPL family transporter, partial [Streptomyces sp. NPDC058964]|uniref:MMPL family transporter n=1 Tax=Streptomyces sp. NPDC058964 TaxID=3346681 RepID=UPI0036BD9B1F
MTPRPAGLTHPVSAAATGTGGSTLVALGLVTAAGLALAVTLFLLRTRRSRPAPPASLMPAEGPTRNDGMTHALRTTLEPPRPEPDGTASAGRLHRAGRWCARRPWWVLGAWLLVMLAALAADRTWGGTYDDDFSLPGTSVQTGADLLDAHGSAGVRGTASQIVLHPGSGALGAHREAVGTAVSELGKLPDVISVADPLRTPGAVSADGTTGMVTVRFTKNPSRFDRSYLDGVDDAVHALRADGVEVEYGGPLGRLARPKAADRLSEAIGLATAVIVLLAGFGSLAAAGLPLLTAVIGLLSGISLLALLAAAVTFG